MASKTDICNEAIINAGSTDLIADVDSGTNLQARMCKAFWDQTIEKVLAEYPWKIARKRIELGRLSGAPAFGYSYQYEVPADCIRIFELDGGYDWTREGQKLLTDATTAIVLYTHRISDTSLFVGDLAELIALLLGSKLALGLSQNRALKADLLNIYSTVLSQAKANDFRESSPNTQTSESSWLTARGATEEDSSDIIVTE